MQNSGTIATLTNSIGGTISGGGTINNPFAQLTFMPGAAGVFNAGTITTLTNSGAISGGTVSVTPGISTGVGGAGLST